MDKRIPMRTCIGCREVKPKNELLRIVKYSCDDREEAGLKADEASLMSGRGAYICKCMECFEKAVRKKGLERTFRMSVPSAATDRLRAELEELLIREHEIGSYQ